MNLILGALWPTRTMHRPLEDVQSRFPAYRRRSMVTATQPRELGSCRSSRRDIPTRHQQHHATEADALRQGLTFRPTSGLLLHLRYHVWEVGHSLRRGCRLKHRYVSRLTAARLRHCDQPNHRLTIVGRHIFTGAAHRPTVALASELQIRLALTYLRRPTRSPNDRRHT